MTTKLERRMRGRSATRLKHTPVSVTRDVIAEAASVLFDMRERLLKVEERGEATTAQRGKRHQLALAAQHLNFALYLANTSNWPGVKLSLAQALTHARLSHVRGATVAVREAMELTRGLNV